jgi:hypothetical protein
MPKAEDKIYSILAAERAWRGAAESAAVWPSFLLCGWLTKPVGSRLNMQRRAGGSGSTQTRSCLLV